MGRTYVATDTNIRKTYAAYMNKANIEFASVKRKLQRLADAKDECYHYLTARKGMIASNLSIELDNYAIEYIDRTYNPLLSLQRVAKRLLNLDKYIGEDDVRRDIIELNKWCSILSNEKETSKKAEVLQRKVTLTFNDYQDLVAIYYNHVHKVLLDGNAYKFGHGIGTCWISRWRCGESFSKYIDYSETRKRKQWLLDNGYVPMTASEMRTAENEGKPVGVPYVVFKERTYGYSLFFTNVRILHSRKPYKIKGVSYISSKYRGMTYQDIIRTYCRTENDVAFLQYDLWKKLHILLLMNPGISNRFDRKQADAYE